MVSRTIRLYGTETVDAPTRTLRAGALSVELENGALRYLKVGDVEVIRGIAFLVRDENWGTFAPEIKNLEIEEREDVFSVRYQGACTGAAGRLDYEARIEGRGDGALDFEVTAVPQSDFVTNRAGFVVLHPLEGVAGQSVKVLHTDGSEELSTFPETIDPMCPIQDIRALSHEIAPGTWATCTMEGDAFEMEDQRNWSDASYKTYIRPLSRPRPYTLPKGEKMTQAVRLSISGALSAPAAGGMPRPLAIAVGGEAGTMPSVGIGVPAEEAAPALENIPLLKQLAPRWLVCQVDLRQSHGQPELEAYRRLGEATGADIVLEIVTKGTMDPAGELEPLARAAAAARVRPVAIAIFPAQDLKSVLPGSSWPEMPSFEETYSAARQAFPGIKLGGGMATYFTELNRKRPPSRLIDYVTHTTCPNVHASDDRSVMETLEALPYQILSTRAFMDDDLPYRIGPSQLGCRENPYGKTTAPNPENGRVSLSRIDPRQRGLFNAAWTLAYVAAFARGGIEAIALGAPTGPFGCIYRRTDFAQPYFDTLDGPAVYPSFHVLAGLARLSEAVLLSTEISDTKKIDALAVRSAGRTTLWLANLTAHEVAVRLPEGSVGGHIASLDAQAFEQSTTRPDFLDTVRRKLADGRVTLDAYAVARVEWD